MRPRSLPVFAAALALGAAEAAPPDKSAEPAPVALSREVAQLRLERELSAGKSFYLRLDAPRQRLALMLQGVTLDDYGTSGLELGVPEVLFVDREPRADWDTAPISKGRLDPDRQRDRIEVTAPAPSPSAPAASTPAASAPTASAQAASAPAASVAAATAGPTPTPSPPPIPKSAEETVSVPSPYRIVFAEGVSLEVRTSGAGARNRSWLRRLVDALGLRASDLGSALGLGSRERVRLRVTLADEDAAALYRSLPPEVGLLVVGLTGR